MTERTRTLGDAGRAIVTFGRGWHSLAVVRSLAARGVEVISADVYGLTPSALSKASADAFTYPDPATDPDGFLDVLEREIRARRPPSGVPYVLQPVQRETYLIADHRERFAGLIDIALPETSLIDRVRDKGELASIASSMGLRVPATWRFDKPPTAEQLAEVELPAIVKIPSGAGGTGMAKVEERDRLATVFAEIHSEHGTLPMIQQLVDGEDLCVTAICDRGSVHSVLTYRNRHKAAESAPGSVRETISAPAAEDATRTLLAELGWHGVAQVDFMSDGESEPWLIEINPRLFGGVFQTVASGIDFPWILYCLASGAPLPPSVEPELGVRTETPVVGLVGILRDILDNEEDTDGDSLSEALATAWRTAKTQTSGEGFGERLGEFFCQAKDILDPADRMDRIQALIDENEDNISQLMFDEDPTAVLGMLYPLAIFAKYGRIDGELLHGSATPEEADS